MAKKTSKTSSLLDKALQHKRKAGGRAFSNGEIELCKAWAQGKIEVGQVSAALDITSSAAYMRLAQVWRHITIEGK